MCYFYKNYNLYVLDDEDCEDIRVEEINPNIDVLNKNLDFTTNKKINYILDFESKNYDPKELPPSYSKINFLNDTNHLNKINKKI